MNYITAEEIKELMDGSEKYMLLDCRSPESYETAHITTAQCLPWREIAEKAEKLIPSKSTLIITSCSSVTCDASEKCYNELEKVGYTNLKEYAGGIADWHARGFKIEGDINLEKI